MRFDPRCIPCIINQAHRAARLACPENTNAQMELMKRVCAAVDSIHIHYTAPRFASMIQNLIVQQMGVTDPYEHIKEQNKATAERYSSSLQAMMECSSDRLETAVRISIIGNSIDLGANPDFNIENEINQMNSSTIDLHSFSRFNEELKNAKTILYIGDNYEEALFDKFLLAELTPSRVIYAVRSRPILNDITLDDAKRIGMDKLCRVVESGSEIPGTDLARCTPEFLALYHTADLVIAKGQGNYETLMEEPRPIYFLFKIKCDVIAERSGYPVGYGVLHYSQGNTPHGKSRPQ